MNQLILVGRLGQNPEERKSQNGETFATFDLATNSKGRDGEGETEWTPCVVFGKNAEISLKELKKGSQVLVIGEKNTKSYASKDGVKREKVSCLVRQVTFLQSAVDKVKGKEAPDFATSDIRF